MIEVWHGLASQPHAEVRLLLLQDALAPQLWRIRRAVAECVAQDLGRRPALMRWFRSLWYPDGTPRAGREGTTDEQEAQGAPHDPGVPFDLQPFCVSFSVYHRPTVENGSHAGGRRVGRGRLLYSSTTAPADETLSLDLAPERVAIAVPGGRIVMAERTVRVHSGHPVYQALLTRRQVQLFYSE